MSQKKKKKDALCDYMIEDSKRAVELHREHMLHALYTHFKTDLTFEILILKKNELCIVP